MSNNTQKTYRITISEQEHFKILALKGKYSENNLFGILVKLEELVTNASNTTPDLKACLMANGIDKIVIDAAIRTKKDLKLFVKEAIEKKAMDEYTSHDSA